MSVRLNVSELRVESFSPVAQQARPNAVLMGSLDDPTLCNCTAGTACTLDCTVQSRATDWQFCCG